MRAIFLETKLETGSNISIEGESAHHLSVARVRPDEIILILNGQGQKGLCKVLNSTKRSTDVMVLEVQVELAKHNVSLAFSVPKKEAMEDIVKIAIELGVNNIYPLTSKFSQFTLEENERLFRIIESALVQSNNLYWPKIYQQQKLDSFLSQLKSPLYYFSSRPEKEEQIKVNKDRELIVLIGPEGGFSIEEEEQIFNTTGVNTIHLPTAIMRAPTAVATSVGYLLSRL
jgi:16S rRNA (uracil1498-N3)-methyltransferase